MLPDADLFDVGDRLEAGRFAVTFDLPVEVDGDKVRATFRQGVLAITLPKSPAVMPKKVSVSVQ
ncbi:MAG: Hsp20/alpha crystallin family protein [Armatimonadota bacterium]|nr:Hsp20/alpha crystallin family protein [Armatimonadota bacterium]